MTRACPGCGGSLEDRDPRVRFCDEACRSKARRKAGAGPQAAGNPVGVVVDEETRSRGPGPAGAAAPGHSWPSLVVAAFRDDEDLAEHAPVWEAHFRERGELR